MADLQLQSECQEPFAIIVFCTFILKIRALSSKKYGYSKKYSARQLTFQPEPF